MLSKVIEEELERPDDGSEFSESTESGMRADEGALDDTPTPIAQNENKAVKWSRFLVIAVLISAAGTAASLTYIFTSKAEESEFKSDVSRRKNLKLKKVKKTFSMD